MLLQLAPIYEVKFLLTLIIIVFGYELGGYFFYHYYKLKDARVPLNRILLSYGSLFLLCITTFLCISIIDEDYGFVTDELTIEIFRSFGYACAALGIMLFLVFIRIQQFSFLINLKIVKYLIYTLFLPIIVAILFDSENRITQLSLGVIIIAAVYMVIFQYRILKNSVGRIKKSFTLMIIAEIIGLTAIFIAAKVVAELFSYLADPTLLYIIGAPFMMIGIFIFFSQVAVFPL